MGSTQATVGTAPDAGRLKKNAISLAGAIALPAAFMGPATSVYFSTFPAASEAGVAVGFTTLLATIVCLMVASTVAEFSRKLPTSGFAYTFGTRTFGPKAGFIIGWGDHVSTAPVVLGVFDRANNLLDENLLPIEGSVERVRQLLHTVV